MPAQDQIQVLREEKATLLSLLHKDKDNFLLHLPRDVEYDFYQSLHRKWIYLGKNHLPIAFLLYLGFFLITASGCLVFFGNLSEHDITLFILSYLTPVLAVIFLTRLYKRKITRETVQTITLSVCVAHVFVNVFFSYSIENSALQIQTNLGVIYLLFLYYLLTGLPLKRLYISINIAFVFSYSLLVHLKIEFSTWVYVITTIVPNTTFFLFMCICRNGDRLNFLQSKILDIDHAINILTQEQLSIMSQQDSLTQLLTRRAFNENFKDVLLNSPPHQTSSLLFIDIDHFKKYNDHYGHIQGDKAINHVADLLKSTLRSSDAISRYGGEEFLVLLPNTHRYDALRIAEKLLYQLRQAQIPHELSEHGILTISIGLTSFSDVKLSEAEQIIDVADQALYEAKRLGRNQVFIMIMPESTPRTPLPHIVPA